MKIILVTLLVSGCVTLSELKATYFMDDRGRCYAVTKTRIIFDVACPWIKK